MKTLAAVLVLTIAPVWAQKLEFNFPGLAAKAKKATEINIDSDVLEKMAGELKLPIDAIGNVVVRSYEFDQPGQYSLSDLADLRKQAADGGWTRIINVKEDDELTEIYALKQNDKMGGFLVIAAEAKELTVVYVQGNITMEQLQAVVQSSIQYDMKGLEQ